MKNDTENARLTAYVLNELPAAERAEVERALNEHPELRREVEDIRATTDLLTRGLAQETAISLDSDRRAAIRAASERPTRPPRRLWWSLPALGTLAAIALTILLPRYYYAELGGKSDENALSNIEPRAKMNAVPTPAVEPAPPAPPAPQSPPVAAVSPAAPAKPKAPSVKLSDRQVVRRMNRAEKDSNVAHYLSARVPQSSRDSRSLARPASGMMAMGGSNTYAGGMVMHARALNGNEQLPAPGYLSPSLDDFPERQDQEFMRTADHPLSTFSIDVDTASYSVMRKFLNDGRLPPMDAVRVEELVNYFPYDYAPPKDDAPFAAHLEAAPAPWNPSNTLVRIALKGREIPAASRPALNLVFLVDVSGSMQPENKLPLVKRALQALVKQLDERDRIALVVYAGSSGMVLPPTSGARTQEIIEALERLDAGGSTAGGSGIQLAYNVAREHFDRKATNRVILCTDGDFNVGLTQRGDLERLIEEQAKSGVFLSVLGFGMGNLKDSTLELLADKGNGNYAYIDDFNEARKALVDQMMGTLVTIAKDVKIQVEFNPARVAGYRLIGYENRLLKKEDFNNDRVDAGDIGAGHTVTAFYELIPVGRPVNDAPDVDPLKYAVPVPTDAAVAGSPDLLTVKLRYKQPDGETSSKLEFPLAADAVGKGAASQDFRFAIAVAAFGQRLRGSKHIGSYSYDQILALAELSVGKDPLGYRAEFLKLVRNAKAIAPNPPPPSPTGRGGEENLDFWPAASASGGPTNQQDIAKT